MLAGCKQVKAPPPLLATQTPVVDTTPDADPTPSTTDATDNTATDATDNTATDTTDSTTTDTTDSTTNSTTNNTTSSTANNTTNNTTLPPPVPTPAPSHSTIWPNSNDGLPITQLGLGFHKDWQGENPYKNQRLMNDNVGGKSKIETGEADPTTGWVYLHPGESLVIGRVRPLAAAPRNFDIDPGVWVLKASIKPALGQGAPTTDISANGFTDAGSTATVIRKTADLTGQLNGNQVTLTGGANGGWIRVDFWGPAKFENDPLGWHPDFLDYVSRYKIVRFMDWIGVNGSKMTTAAEYIDDGDYTVQSSSGGWPYTPPAAHRNLYKGGYQFSRIFDLAIKADIAPWINVPITLGGKSVETELWGVNGNNGPVSKAAMKSAIVANAPKIFAAAEVEYRALADKMAKSALAAGLPDTTAIIIEPGNELWNSGSPAFSRSLEYTAGIGRALVGNDDVGYGQGYLSAIAVRAFKERFAAIKPGQELVFVMGFQTGAYGGVGSFRALNAVAGFLKYEKVAGLPQSNLGDVFGGTTGYYSGAFKWNNKQSPGKGNPWGATTETAFNAAFAADAVNESAMFTRIRNWHLGPAANQNIAAMVANNAGFRDLAVANGMAGILQYEGSAHEDLQTKTGTLGKVFPAAALTSNHFMRSAEGRDIQRSAIAQLRAIKPTSPAKTTGFRPSELPLSNYMSVGGLLKAGAPWIELESNEIGQCAANATVAGAWCEVLRPPVSAR